MWEVFINAIEHGNLGISYDEKSKLLDDQTLDEVTTERLAAEKFQNQLMGEQQNIETKKQTQGQALSEDSFKFTEGLQKDLKDFLEEYNKEKKYMYILTTGTGLDYLVYKNPALNITNDVIKGMNTKMNAKAK